MRVLARIAEDDEDLGIALIASVTGSGRDGVRDQSPRARACCACAASAASSATARRNSSPLTCVQTPEPERTVASALAFEYCPSSAKLAPPIS